MAEVQVQYLHKALLAQLDGVGGLEEVRAGGRGSSWRERLSMLMHCTFLCGDGREAWWVWEAPSEKAKGWEQESGPELLRDAPPHLKPPFPTTTDIYQELALRNSLAVQQLGILCFCC